MCALAQALAMDDSGPLISLRPFPGNYLPGDIFYFLAGIDKFFQSHLPQVPGQTKKYPYCFNLFSCFLQMAFFGKAGICAVDVSDHLNGFFLYAFSKSILIFSVEIFYCFEYFQNEIISRLVYRKIGVYGHFAKIQRNRKIV